LVAFSTFPLPLYLFSLQAFFYVYYFLYSRF